MNTRRRFIQILPLAGVAAVVGLSACSDKAPPPAAVPAPAPAPAPAAAPAPAPASPAPTAGAALPMLDPADPAAVALGYVAVASKVDSAKYKTYIAGSACSNCALFGGKAGDAAGPCPLFPGKQVSAAGWSTAYVKKG